CARGVIYYYGRGDYFDYW
nr:immunoglobulin heavy chain junction region [Mus musculus]MBK4197938.1 immunoglobulin heavy chain junction region [Mus musculus]MBK4197939.1 immunoglobulin heavy chain junction region [Mus musculus]MBK4197941.1 immunoglobulin heavy chain junction region [Mus musculus]MBK4197942.1 immunoglobulin heavy chain junction region [Mus musculus]